LWRTARARRQYRHRDGKAAPDGYTIVGGGSGPVAANLTLYKSLATIPKDLEMISPFAGFTIVIVVSKSLPVHSLKELIDYECPPRTELWVGRDWQLAASRRRVFRSGDGREDHPRALSQYRPIWA
jgi:hypothetical protein